MRKPSSKSKKVAVPAPKAPKRKEVAELTAKEIAGYMFASRNVEIALSGFRESDTECEFIQQTLRNTLKILNEKYASRVRECNENGST